MLQYTNPEVNGEGGPLAYETPRERKVFVSLAPLFDDMFLNGPDKMPGRGIVKGLEA